jgi:hypothetical protein
VTELPSFILSSKEVSSGLPCQVGLSGVHVLYEYAILYSLYNGPYCPYDTNVKACHCILNLTCEQYRSELFTKQGSRRPTMTGIL